MAVEVESPWVIGLVSGLVVALLSPILQSLFQHYMGRRQRLFELKNEIFSEMVIVYGRMKVLHNLFERGEKADYEEGCEGESAAAKRAAEEWMRVSKDLHLEVDRLEGLISVFFSKDVHLAYLKAATVGYQGVGVKRERQEYLGRRNESIRAMARELGLEEGGASWVRSMALSCSSRTKAMFGYLARWWGRVFKSHGPC